MELKKIASFQVDHTKLSEGMYTSRIDGDIVTYDIRMVKPNGGEYLDIPALHTFEHLFATYARSSSQQDKVVYAGPMGCRTGFCFLVRDLAPLDAISLVQRTMAFITAFDGPIPGATESECGNYREHDLPGARRMAEKMVSVLAGWTAERLSYCR